MTGNKIVDTFDHSEHTALTSSIADSHYHQLGDGSFNGRIQQLNMSEITLFSESHNRSVLKNGTLKKGLCTISFLSTQQQSIRMSQFKLQQSTVAFLPEEHEFEVQVPANCEGFFFVLNQQALIEAAEKEEHWLAQSHGEIKAVETASNHPLFDFPNILINTTKTCQRTKAYFNRLLIDFTLDALISNHNDNSIKSPVSLSRAYALTRRARDFIEQNIIRPITILEICNAIGSSRRALQYAFNTVFGISPVNYLRTIRLNRVRKELLMANLISNKDSQIITTIALDWGFVHLGRFSQDYKKLFGESPTTSLNRPI